MSLRPELGNIQRLNINTGEGRLSSVADGRPVRFGLFDCDETLQGLIKEIGSSDPVWQVCPIFYLVDPLEF